MTTQNSTSQCSHWLYKNDNLSLTISAVADTFILGDKMFLEAKIINNSKKPVIIPKNYSLTSNLYPNGNSNDRLFKGGLFKLQIDTVSQWTAIHIEEMFITKETEFITLKPDSSTRFKIDVGDHINSYNQETSNDSLKIKSGSFYTLQLTYSSGIDNIQNEFKGHLVSNKVRMVIR